MRPLVVLPEDRPCAPCAPALPPARPKGYCRPLPPARRRPPSVLWRRIRLALLFIAVALVGSSGAYVWFRTDWPAQAQIAAQEFLGEAGASVELRLAEVNLRGRVHTPLEMLAEAVAVERGDPILSLDLDTLRRRVEAIGWVQPATVCSPLQDTLHFEIFESVPPPSCPLDSRIHP